MQNIQFTTHYDLARLTASDTATRFNYTEQWEPPREVIDWLQQLATNILQPLRNAIGVSYNITCAYRCPRTNKKVGGAANSQHGLGQAADKVLWIGGVNKNLLMAQTIINQSLPFDQLILEGGTLLLPNWIHTSYGPRNRRQILKCDFITDPTTKKRKAVYSVLKPEDVLNAK